MENWNVVSMKPELNATEELTDERNSLVMVTGDDSRIIADFYSEEDATRSANCVNACAGIPDAELPNVRPVFVIHKCWTHPEMGQEFRWEWSTRNISPNVENEIRVLNEMLDDGATFGELDQLIRECR